ncbi:MAG: hypothetical protein R3C02_17060 [Planctomycetaceae bacterium]
MDLALTITSPQWQPVTDRNPVVTVEGQSDLAEVDCRPTFGDFTTNPIIFNANKTWNPWLGKKLSVLDSMRVLDDSWHAFGGLPPNEVAISLATTVLEAAAELDFEPDNVDPSVDEGVCISFRDGNRYADIECFNTGDILAAESTGADPEIWEVDDSDDGIEGAVARILDFISKQ